MRRWGLCGSGSIAGASAAASRERASMICWNISVCHALGSSADAVPDYSAGFSMPGPDAETSISEEPGARKRHAGICAGAVRATGRPTAIRNQSWRVTVSVSWIENGGVDVSVLVKHYWCMSTLADIEKA